MPLEINDEDIGYAEQILFGERGVFDEERIAFIKNTETIDLQAVPGSGKTTALLAKLLIIEKYLPFSDGSGVLVISHTNAAVNEIIDKIGKHCPKLFAYPNFVGTIQSFVDKFLAIPFAHNFLGVGIKWIDTDRFQDMLWRKVRSIYWSDKFATARKYLYGRHFSQCLKETKNDKKEAQKLCDQMIEKDIRNLFFDFTDSKLKKSDNKEVFLQNSKLESYKELKAVIDEVISKEVISYEYAYHLAEIYINKIPKIKNLIRLRFKFVFVDEMQDMEKYQHDLLENIFSNDGVVYQRIGDKNQAIYSGKISLEEIWENRQKCLSLKGSHRLSPNIAQVVNKFALDNAVPIDGNGQSDISPCMIVFNENVINQVIKKFVQLITEKIPRELIAGSKHPIKCIGWRKEAEGANLGIKNFYEDFETKASVTKTYYPNLKSYLDSWKISHPQKHILNAARKSILEAIVTVITKEEIVQPNGKYFNTRSLFKHLRDTDSAFYENFKSKVFSWSRDLFIGKMASVFADIKEYLPSLLAFFGKATVKSLSFINDEAPAQLAKGAEEPVSKNDNTYCCAETGIEVKVGTVHSVKGETHLATLYLETFYNKKYESDRLPGCFCNKGNQFSGDHEKQTAKISYVAMSRPTHLLCFAIHKDRFMPIKDDIRDWEIIDLT